MKRRRGPKVKVTVKTRIEEYPDEFRIDDGLLFCNVCDHSVDWVRLMTTLIVSLIKIKKIYMKTNNVGINKHLLHPFLPLNLKKL